MGVYSVLVVIVLVIFIIAWKVWMTPAGQPSIPAAQQNQPVQTNDTGAPAAVTQSPSIPVTPTSGTNPPAEAAPSATVTRLSTQTPIVLPTYYAQQLASSTLNVHLVNPASNSQVASPLLVTGEAQGWYFEGVFPIYLTDANGYVLAHGQAVAQSDWTVPGFVQFSATLSFPRQKSGGLGYLILKKDNPSGLPSKDASVEIPVYFQ